MGPLARENPRATGDPAMAETKPKWAKLPLALVIAAWIGCFLAGCTISRRIVPLEPPADMPPLEELQGGLDIMVREFGGGNVPERA